MTSRQIKLNNFPSGEFLDDKEIVQAKAGMLGWRWGLGQQRVGRLVESGRGMRLAVTSLAAWAMAGDWLRIGARLSQASLL